MKSKKSLKKLSLKKITSYEKKVARKIEKLQKHQNVVHVISLGRDATVDTFTSEDERQLHAKVFRLGEHKRKKKFDAV